MKKLILTSIITLLLITNVNAQVIRKVGLKIDTSTAIVITNDMQANVNAHRVTKTWITKSGQGIPQGVLYFTELWKPIKNEDIYKITN